MIDRLIIFQCLSFRWTRRKSQWTCQVWHRRHHRNRSSLIQRVISSASSMDKCDLKRFMSYPFLFTTTVNAAMGFISVRFGISFRNRFILGEFRVVTPFFNRREDHGSSVMTKRIRDERQQNTSPAAVGVVWRRTDLGRLSISTKDRFQRFVLCWVHLHPNPHDLNPWHRARELIYQRKVFELHHCGYTVAIRFPLDNSRRKITRVAREKTRN